MKKSTTTTESKKKGKKGIKIVDKPIDYSKYLKKSTNGK